jgi:hypothetical protein
MGNVSSSLLLGDGKALEPSSHQVALEKKIEARRDGG